MWPENWDICRLFGRLMTQWRFAGMGARVGLDYCAVYPLLDRMYPDDPEEWDRAFDDLTVMESAALDQIEQNHS